MLDYHSETVVTIGDDELEFARIRCFKYTAEPACCGGLAALLYELIEHTDYLHPCRVSRLSSRIVSEEILPYDYGAITSAELLNLIGINLMAVNLEDGDPARCRMADALAPLLSVKCFQLDREVFPDVLQVVGIDWNSQDVYLLAMAAPYAEQSGEPEPPIAPEF